MKKKFSLLFLIIMLLSSLDGFAEKSESNINNEKLSNAANLLNVLDISDATFTDSTYNETITRADFVVYASKLLNDFVMQSTFDKTYFDDVPLDFWGLSEINLLVDAGVLSVPENKQFRPNDYILKSEAIKIVLSLMKYDGYCELNGGYPQGYINVAYEYDMDDNLSSGEYMTYADTLMLIYNALEVPMMPQKYESTVSYEDETLLSYYFDAYSVEGKVTSAEGFVIDGDIAYSGEIAIDGEKYYIKSTAGVDFLGKLTRAYIKRASKNDIGTVIALENIQNKNTVIEIDICDVKEFNINDYTIEYYKNKSNKTDVAKLNPGILVLKNGEDISDDLKNAFNFDKGITKLVDSDNDGYFDYAFNSAYKNIMVGYIDLENKIIYDKLNPQNKVSLEEYKDEEINIFKNGAKANFSEIAEGSVLSVFDSVVYLRIDICTQNISGTVFEKNEDGQTEILVGINPTEADRYIVNTEYAKYDEAKLIVGAKGTFYLDTYSKIAYGVIDEDGRYTFAYVKKVIEDEDNDCLNIKLLEQSGANMTLKCSAKLRVDDKTLKTTDAQKNILVNTKGQVIRIKKSGDEIIEIDTALPISESKTAQSFTKTYEEKKQRYVYGQKRFGTLIIHSDNTVFFVVPSDSEDMREELYNVVNRSFFMGARNYDVESYKLNSGEYFESVIVAKAAEAPPIDFQTMFLVADKSTVIGEGDEPIILVEGYYGGTKSSFMASELLDCSLFDEGDIIMITGKDLQGCVTSCIVRYDDDAEKPTFDYSADGINEISKNEFHNYHYMVGNVIDTSGGVIAVGYNDIENVNLKMQASSVGSVICYDKSEKGENKFYKGTIKDFVPSHYANPECTKIVAWLKNGDVQWAVAYQPSGN